MILLDIYDVNLKYIRDLHNVDSNVASQSPQIGKSDRVYLGIIVVIDNKKYCIPFSSGTKEKYQHKNKNLDIIKIPNMERKNQNGSYTTLAVLNVNNMIPVDDLVVSKVNLKLLPSDNVLTRQRKTLLQKELKWCRENSEFIVHRVKKVYSLVVDTPEKSRNLTRRCCDFKKLETVLEKWLRRNGSSSDSESANVSVDCSNGSSESDDDVLDLTDDGDFINSSIKR